MQTLIVKTDGRTQLLDVTAQVQKVVSAAKISKGICYLYVRAHPGRRWSCAEVSGEVDVQV